MKTLNDFKNFFSILGIVSLIFWTCASESVSNTVNPPQLIGGNYQIESSFDNRFFVLNTETGVMKTYTVVNNQWVEYPEFYNGHLEAITFTH
tara:strand:+ start:355 stop:630 length:276 start_codon:yes stop_codon:yes gene_type:complete